MANYSNIPTGLNITSQIPLDKKQFILNESTLADLGVNNNLAFTYYDGLKVFCKQERTLYEWREVQSGEENTGLIPTDFIYPGSIIVDNVVYSNKKYNFFQVINITSDNIADYADLGPQGPAGVNGINADITRTSTTSLTIGNSGSKTLSYTASNNLGWVIGMRLRFSKDINNYIEGVISAVSSTSVTITADYSVGTGTYATWTIGIAGDRGTTGNISSGTLLYEIKQLDIPSASFSAYMAANFDGTGLGIGSMIGFAVCNGNNGTIDRGGRVSIGYHSTNYPTIGALGGATSVSLTEGNIPKLDLTVPVSDAGGGGAPYTNVLASPSGTPDTKTFTNVIGNTTPTPINNMQPYVVTLFIQKIV